MLKPLTFSFHNSFRNESKMKAKKKNLLLEKLPEKNTLSGKLNGLIRTNNKEILLKCIKSVSQHSQREKC